jgi:hypothetical protein
MEPQLLSWAPNLNLGLISDAELERCKVELTGDWQSEQLSEDQNLITGRDMGHVLSMVECWRFEDAVQIAVFKA